MLFVLVAKILTFSEARCEITLLAVLCKDFYLFRSQDLELHCWLCSVKTLTSSEAELGVLLELAVEEVLTFSEAGLGVLLELAVEEVFIFSEAELGITLFALLA